MQTNLLRAIISIATLAIPLQGMAIPVTIEIDEVIFSGLGDCGTNTPDPSIGACDGTVPIDINLGPSVNPNWPNWGLNLPFDMLRMQEFLFTGDIGPVGGASVLQEADFAVGQTGGGSAGPGPNTSIVYPIRLDRNVVVNGQTNLLEQAGTLEIGWQSDTLIIDPADLVVVLTEGTLTIHFDGAGPLTVSADPPIDQAGQISFRANVPAPPTLTAMLLGLVGFYFARRKIEKKITDI